MQMKSVGMNVLLVVFSVTLSVLAVEVFFRILQYDAAFQGGRELPWLRESAHLFTVDPAFGFRPIFNTGIYSVYGTRQNNYNIVKRDSAKRILFIGDSVTSRGKIIEALRDEFGTKDYEYWNAGVESFNTVQEYNYLKRYNLAINPDHVILSFHLNDYETTPVVFYEGDELRVYAPDTRLENAFPWLLQNSYLYRMFLNVASQKEDAEVLQARKSIFREVQEHLEKMRDLLAREGIPFTVIVLPYFKPYEQWTQYQAERRAFTLATLEDLDIPHFDLLALSEEAHKKQIRTQEVEGDILHPSDAVSAIFARHLHEQGVF